MMPSWLSVLLVMYGSVDRRSGLLCLRPAPGGERRRCVRYNATPRWACCGPVSQHDSSTASAPGTRPSRTARGTVRWPLLQLVQAMGGGVSDCGVCHDDGRLCFLVFASAVAYALWLWCHEAVFAPLCALAGVCACADVDESAAGRDPS